MKFLIKLILVQVIAVIQSPIERALNDWTSIHYNWWPAFTPSPPCGVS